MPSGVFAQRLVHHAEHGLATRADEGRDEHGGEGEDAGATI
jgi:hypothetical protein